MKSTLLRFRLSMPVLLLTVVPLAHAAQPFSGADKEFAGKVSQGGMYEVAASKLASGKAQSQKVKDIANTEVHDHDLVNSKLAKIATAAGIKVSGRLNSTFQQRLKKLSSVSGTDFDAAYIADMKEIHNNDEKLFAQEAVDGSGGFKPFAAETDMIVKRHIGTLAAQ